MSREKLTAADFKNIFVCQRSYEESENCLEEIQLKYLMNVFSDGRFEELTNTNIDKIVFLFWNAGVMDG
ncbi:MAG: hypothetical protein KatS3mg028_1136 [Bacteroidia bacterium]|nr:MAG: hypothetical protein KatS3mg028_1136 [Bacteroidia bacterium]